MTSKPTAEQAAPKKRGAPFKPAAEVKSDRLEIRLKPQDREKWQAKAQQAGKSLNAWIEDVCNASAQ